jgi:hypothetical protein
MRWTRMKEDGSNVRFRHCSLPPEPQRKVTVQWKESGWRSHVEFVRHQTTRGICGLELGNTSKALPIHSSAHDLSCSFPILEVNRAEESSRWDRSTSIHGAHLPGLGSCWQPLDVSSGAAWPGYAKRTRDFDADEGAALCDGSRTVEKALDAGEEADPVAGAVGVAEVDVGGDPAEGAHADEVGVGV